jgi:hypothetical protein
MFQFIFTTTTYIRVTSSWLRILVPEYSPGVVLRTPQLLLLLCRKTYGVCACSYYCVGTAEYDTATSSYLYDSLV